jgi:maltose-binding protein MalE
MMQRARDDRGQTGDVEQWTESKLGKFAKLGYLLDVTVEEISDALRGGPFMIARRYT